MSTTSANDNWGIGWAQTHFSGDLRGLVAVLGARVDSSENVVEAFYNVAITPAARLAVNLQYIDSANPARGNATVLGTRLQLDFLAGTGPWEDLQEQRGY